MAMSSCLVAGFCLSHAPLWRAADPAAGFVWDQLENLRWLEPEKKVMCMYTIYMVIYYIYTQIHKHSNS